MMKNLGLALAAVALLATAACGGSDSSDGSSSSSSSASSSSSSSGDRPSADQLSASLQKGYKLGSQEVKLPKTQADCLSKVLVDSDLSDKAIKAFEKGDTNFKPSTSDTSAANKLESKIQGCAGPSSAPSQ